MIKKIISFLVIIGLFACNNQQQNHKINKQSVTVSVLPQKYFVDKIAGDRLSINVMIPPGASPVTYEPTPKQMKELSASNLFVLNIKLAPSYGNTPNDLTPV